MHKLAQNWYALVFVIAVIAALVLQHTDARSRDAAQIVNLVAGCESNSARTALNAAGWFQLSLRVAARGHAGDEKSADLYAGISDSITQQIPVAHEQDKFVVAQAHVIETDGHARLVLTPAAKAAQRAGCEARYKL